MQTQGRLLFCTVVTCIVHLVGQGELCLPVTVDERLHYLMAGDLHLTIRWQWLNWKALLAAPGQDSHLS